MDLTTIPNRGGFKESLYIPPVQGAAYGVMFGPNWASGVDFEGDDFCPVYCQSVSDTFRSGDMLRICKDTRRWNFGAAIGTPNGNRATFTFHFNHDTPAALQVKPWNETLGPVPIDAIDLRQSSDADRRWIVFGQGSGLKDFRLGFVRDALCIYNANGATATPDKPGRLIFKLWPNGDVWFAGKIRTEPK